MKKLAITLLLLGLFQYCFAVIFEVKQDSTGDYVKIQDAIDAVIWPNDTILVWPGTYYENLNIENKHFLTIASLFLTTNDNSYKYNTIIDGNQNGSCINIENSTDTIVINGFTVRNGRGRDGGGIRVFESVCNTLNCIVTNNNSWKSGGGISVTFDSYSKLSNNSIFNNHAYGSGGGVFVAVDSEIEFDSTSRNNLYYNNAERGCDFTKTESAVTSVIFLDTCTVENPIPYFFIAIDESGNPIDELEYSINFHKIVPYDGNIYVNPNLGNNNNSGTSWDDPLKSIAWAYSKIHVDSINPNTIYLANGIYSDTTNDEKFHLNIRPFVNIERQSRDNVILDGNRNIYILKGNNKITDYSIKKMTLQGGPFPDYNNPWGIPATLAHLYWNNHRFILDSILFKDSFAFEAYGILTYGFADSSIVRNCEFRDNIGGITLRTAIGKSTPGKLQPDSDKDEYGEKQYISNTKFIRQKVDPNDDGNNALVLVSQFQGTDYVQNCLFQDNDNTAIIKASMGGNAYLTNCTFVNNSELEDRPAIHAADGSIHMYNCIAYNNYENPIRIAVGEWQQMVHSNLNIYNSLIDGGEESIDIGASCWHDDTVWCHVYYNYTNIDADPQFLGMWNHPYQLTDNSPCIDAGTLANLPDFIELEDYDLAGNPRVYGDSIDMGAYEWDPTIVGFHEIGPGSNADASQSLTKASPNPFYQDTYIEIEPKQLSTEARVEVYDNYGKLVKTLITTQLNNKVKVLWRGDDNSGNPLPSGVYHVVMFYGDKEVESLKVVKR